MAILILIGVLQSCLKLERCKPHKGVRHPTKCDVINDVKLFLTLSQIFDVIQSNVALQKQVHWNKLYKFTPVLSLATT